MNPPTQASVQARYLNGDLVSVIATDYGGYAVTFPVSQLPGAYSHCSWSWPGGARLPGLAVASGQPKRRFARQGLAGPA